MTLSIRPNFTVCKLGWQRHAFSLVLYTPRTIFTIDGLSLSKELRS